LAKECHLYEADPNPEAEGGQIHTTTIIEAPNKFPFSVSATPAVFFCSNFNSIRLTIRTLPYMWSRNRRFLGDAPDYEYDGKQVSLCQICELRERIGNEKDGAAELWKGMAKSGMQKGLGLVYYRKTYGSGLFKMEARLTDIFPMSELERKATDRVWGIISLILKKLQQPRQPDWP
jgi:hypothetical protein